MYLSRPTRTRGTRLGRYPVHSEDRRAWLLFAYREIPVETLGFSPFELLFGRLVRGPLALLKSTWLKACDSKFPPKTKPNVIQYSMSLRERLTKCNELALETAENARTRFKIWYDKKARERKFDAGDLVLVLLPTPGKPFHSKYFGPYKVIRQVGPVEYLIATPEKRRTDRICHLNMLKRYIERHSDFTDDTMTAIHTQVVESALDLDLGPSCSPSYDASSNVQTFKTICHQVNAQNLNLF